MRAWHCDCGRYVDGPETRAPFEPQPRPGNVELEGELRGCASCDPWLSDRQLAAALGKLSSRLDMKCSTWFEGGNDDR